MFHCQATNLYLYDFARSKIVAVVVVGVFFDVEPCE